jgi:hypothetical protein
VLFNLCDGDISKVKEIENLDVELCYDWYYILRVKELNELRLRIAEWKRIKEM